MGGFISSALRKPRHTSIYLHSESKSGDAFLDGDDNSLTFWRPISDNSSLRSLIASPYVDSIRPVSGRCRGRETPKTYPWRWKMLSIEDLESACNASQRVDTPRHIVEPPELPFQATFYPFGFPAVITTNSGGVLKQYEELWGRFTKQHDTEPIRAEVQVVESNAKECPPEPVYRYMQPLLMCVADADNYSMVDLEGCHAKIVISRVALRHRLYAQYFLLSAAACCVASRYTTPVHAGCVALDGRGVLLCGDSGAGKSTLAYACGRAGWTYVSDDGSFLLNGGTKRLVTGDCHLVRFRPTAAELFPEVRGLEITPRAAGKPSIELPTASIPNLVCAPTTRVDFVVFLNRRAEGPRGLVPYRKDVARQSIRQVPLGPPKSRARKYAAIENLLTAEIFELRYTDLDWAVDRLRTLVKEGQ